MENWEKIRPLLEKALEIEGGLRSIADVLDMIRLGKAQLWTGKGAVVITQVTEYPKERVLDFYLAAGDLSELVRMHDQILDEARQIGISRARITGRRGWMRALEGYDEVFTTIERKLEPWEKRAAVATTLQ